jgi:hypothetical protein
MESSIGRFATNQRMWDHLTHIHLQGSSCYPIEEFRRGKCQLRDVDRREVGDVAGKRLLHLQCSAPE